MSDFTWNAAYYSDLQSLYALLVVPLAFLAWRLASPPDLKTAEVPPAARFVAMLTLVFAFETMLDPVATGPLKRSAAIDGTIFATLIPFLFVLLGDLRVLLLAIGVAKPERSTGELLRWAGAMTLIVPIATGVLYGGLRFLVPDIHGQVMWMIYEFGFLCLCVYLSRVWLPENAKGAWAAETTRYLRAIFGYSAAYYALWFIADVFIVVADLDLGWAIRIVPNQLYYAFWIPFAYWRFFSAASASTEKAAR
ncbi:MAG: hypothetical protein AB8G23_14900 [Myxococcota bacterium]